MNDSCRLFIHRALSESYARTTAVGHMSDSYHIHERQPLYAKPMATVHLFAVPRLQG